MPQNFINIRSDRSQTFLRFLLSLFLIQPTGLFALAVSPPKVSKLTQAKPDEAAQKKIHQAYMNLPLYFEKNEGQADPQVRFTARGKGYSLFLTPAEAVLTLNKPHLNHQDTKGTKNGSGLDQFLTPNSEFLIRDSEVVRMRLVGGNRLCRITGEEALASKSNFFLGDNPDKWRTEVGNYAKVKMDEVYPGIDMVYYGHQGQLEYDFVVKPGANPSDIQLRFDGAKNVKVGKNGELQIRVLGGSLSFKAPVIYQTIDNQKAEVLGKFVKIDGNKIGFEIGGYDPTKSLVIDPPLFYSTYLGGSSDEDFNDIAVDSSGNAYVTGQAWPPGAFPTTGGSFQTVFAGGASYSNAFVAKLNPAGTGLVYSTYLGGSDGALGNGIKVDGSGNAYISGTAGANFPTTSGAFQTGYLGGPMDIFVTKLNPPGNALIYSTYIGGGAQDADPGIAIDAGGNAYVAGWTWSIDYPTTPGAFQTSCLVMDGYVSKLNTTGSALVYSTFLGGSGIDSVYSIAVDTSGNAYVVGSTNSADFPTTPGAYDTTFNGGANDVFVTKVNSTGTGLVYSTYLGGNSEDNGVGMAVDAAGSAYVSGWGSSSNFPTTAGAYQTIPEAGNNDAFVVKFDAAGSSLIYSTLLIGGDDDYAGRIALDGSGRAYVAGSTRSNGFPVTGGAHQTAHNGNGDAFMVILDPIGAGLSYSTYFGGGNVDWGNGIALDGVGGIYLAGRTLSTDFPITGGAYQTVKGGSSVNDDVFVAKFFDAVLTPTPTATPTATLFITPTPTSTLTITPTGFICNTALFVSRNIYFPQTDNPLLFIQSTLCFSGPYAVKIYNSAGEEVRVLRDVANQPVGTDQVDWDGKNQFGEYVASGVYLIRVIEAAGVYTARVAVVR